MSKKFHDDLKIKSEYDKIAKVYDDFWSPHWPNDPVLKTVINFVAKNPGGERILELGIGSGNISGLLSLEGYSDITGVDLSEKLTTIARTKIPDLKLRLENVNETSFLHFDWIIMLGNIIERVREKESFFARMYQELEDESFLFVDAGIQNDYENEKLARLETIRSEQGQLQIYSDGVKQGIENGELVFQNEDQVIRHEYQTFPIHADDLEKLIQATGFHLIDFLSPQDSGYLSEIYVFKKY